MSGLVHGGGRNEGKAARLAQLVFRAKAFGWGAPSSRIWRTPPPHCALRFYLEAGIRPPYPHVLSPPLLHPRIC